MPAIDDCDGPWKASNALALSLPGRACNTPERHCNVSRRELICDCAMWGSGWSGLSDEAVSQSVLNTLAFRLSSVATVESSVAERWGEESKWTRDTLTGRPNGCPPAPPDATRRHTNSQSSSGPRVARVSRGLTDGSALSSDGKGGGGEVRGGNAAKRKRPVVSSCHFPISGFSAAALAQGDRGGGGRARCNARSRCSTEANGGRCCGSSLQQLSTTSQISGGPPLSSRDTSIC
mmetsp:Transcript_73454/g.172576  ORF Transcript_73454/g.172576 Transcript_73454/m.172576 type:complete len:234 (+) Transcript_73454:513-1214(+)